MPSISSDARFLGVDIALLWRDMREPWRNVHQWPVLAWLTPQPPVLLLQADGKQSVWEDGRQVSPRATPRFKAIELPDELVLRRPIQLPVMAADDARAAMALEARSNSPFDAADMVWGYSLLQSKGAHAAQRCELVLASRKQVAQHLAAVQSGPLGQSVDWSGAEVWVLTAHGQPAVLPGYGEAAREAHGASRRRWGFVLLATLALGVAALAITPTIQLRTRALEAAQAHEALVKSAAPVVHQRERLLASVESLGALSELTNGRIEPLRVLDTLTQVLPDDTALQSLKIQGGKLIFSGQTGNASALMQRLGDVQGFKEVRAPAATTRLANISKDVFAVELSLDAEVFGVKSTQLASPVAVPAGAASAPSLSSGSAPSAASSSVALAASAAPAPSSTASGPPVATGAKADTPALLAPTGQAIPSVAPVGASAGASASFGGKSVAPPAPVQPPASAPVRKGASS
ncbi:PilN domain-containing protein [Acidovorax sp. 106]|uniref:PilN domain-containing protein n=1 Tax=Acidovorax sp. 106 TaxID=2135637 RepID=UPI000EB568FE|nr:PilN domain-containing protein [Acidovorax sp. 106]RLJ38464.1 general secretion pathway protein L [Acidovorax sp. 106]